MIPSVFYPDWGSLGPGKPWTVLQCASASASDVRGKTCLVDILAAPSTVTCPIASLGPQNPKDYLHMNMYTHTHTHTEAWPSLTRTSAPRLLIRVLGNTCRCLVYSVLLPECVSVFMHMTQAEGVLGICINVCK